MKKNTKQVVMSSKTGRYAKKPQTQEERDRTMTLTVPTGKEEITVEQAVKTLTDALRNDSDFFFAYQSNIVMAFVDEAEKCGLANKEVVYEVSNNAAKNFLNLLISYPKQAAEATAPEVCAETGGVDLSDTGGFGEENNEHLAE